MRKNKDNIQDKLDEEKQSNINHINMCLMILLRSDIPTLIPNKHVLADIINAMRGYAGQKIGDITYLWGCVLVCQKSGYFYELCQKSEMEFY